MNYTPDFDVVQGENVEATPLDLIGGSHTPKSNPPPKISPYSVLSNCFFDWYQCSLSVPVPELVSVLSEHYGAFTRPGRPQPPYQSCYEFLPIGIRVSDKTVEPFCSIHFGGVNEKALLRASSDNAADFADFVRNTWPDHSVSRADVALDFQEGATFFSDMSKMLIEYAEKYRLKTAFAGDWAQGLDGRTLYIGSRKSAVFIRLYEKGLEQLAKGNSTAPVDWVRFEIEIKPSNREAKERMATVEPRECFGASRLLRDFSELLGDQYQSLRVGTVRKQVDFDRTFSHLCYQYGDLFSDLLHQCQGDPVQFVEKIMQQVEQEKETRAGIRETRKSYARRDLGRCYVRPALGVAFWRQYPSVLSGLTYRPLLSVPSLLVSP